MSGTRASKTVAFFGIILLAGVFAPPPGAIVREMAADFDGTASGHYRVITSRSPLGAPPNDQWYFSIYAPPAGGESLVYQSPSATDRYALVPKLEQGAGTTRYFPQESVALAGRGNLMGEPRDQVLVLVHEAAADCGSATLSILSMQSGAVEIPVQVTNPCSLAAKIVHHTIVLRGPYYKASAPLYKPTKNNATATLRYVDGAWVEKPNYFKLRYPRVPTAAVTPLTSPSPLFTPIFKSIVTTPAPSGAPRPPAKRSG